MKKERFRRLGIQPDKSINKYFFEKLEEKDLEPATGEKIVVLVVDVETTGLDSRLNKIIELGYLKLEVDKSTGMISKIIKRFNELEDPKEPLSKEIIRITGITDSDLKGKSINWEEVELDMIDVDLCIAHNSTFDRPFIERKIRSLRNVDWTCSLDAIPWFDWNFPSRSLENLTDYHGFYFEGHRAINDCEALARLLIINTPESNDTYFKILIDGLSNDNYLLAVKNTPYETKDLFNKQEFRWEGTHKFWFKYFDNKEETDSVHKLLKESLSRYKSATIEKVKINPKRKYKDVAILSKIKEENSSVLTINDGFKKEKPYIIVAEHTAYETKDKLKKRGYFWSQKYRSWYLYVTELESEKEKDWLRDNVYPNNLFKGKVIENPKFKK